MEKNKNRTDLLAAGRKKLQQYRQKKDGKGSKGKANKPDPDESSSAAKSTKGKKQLPAAEVPVLDSATEPVDSSNVDAVTSDRSSTSDLPIEVSEPDESINASVSDEYQQSSSLDDAMPAVSSPRTVNIDENPENDYVSVASVGLKAVHDDNSTPGELKAASGEDQVPDVGEMQERDHSCSEPDNKTSFVDVETDERAQVNVGDVEEDSKMGCTSSATEQISEHDHPCSEPDNKTSFVDVERNERDQVNLGDVDEDSKLEATSSATEQISEGDHSCSEPDKKACFVDVETDERAQVNLGDGEEDSKVEYSSSAAEQISERDGFPVFVGAIESDTNNADLNSSSAPPSFDPEPTVQLKEVAVTEFHGDEGIKLPVTSGDSDVTPVSLTQLAKAFQLLGEDEFRFVMAAREAVTSRDLKNDSDMKSDAVEFSERIREQLYINNFEKELLYLQLNEESDARKEFDNEKSSSASLVDVEGKNKILSEELANCKSELDKVASKMENLQKEFSFSKTALEQSSSRIEELQIELGRSEHQLSNVSSELVDSRSLLSDLQEKNENLNVSIASLTEEKHNLEKEKGDVILENEKMMKELMECKSLLELLQVENGNTKESLALLKEERAKLEDEKENYVSEKESLLTELVEWKRSTEGLQAENANLNAVLTSEREDRSKLEEANGQFVEEIQKFSTELLKSQHLVENLRSEIANFEKERTRFEEETNHLNVEKEEALVELTNCKTLMKNLQLEYEKSMIDLKDGAVRLAQLTEENDTLTSTLDGYKVQIDEFDDWKMKSEKYFRSEITNFEKERTRFEEEINHLSAGKEEALNELTNCKNIVKNLQMEYEKSITDLKDGAVRFAQLTEENVTLTTTLDTYKAKIDEFNDWKMKSEQRDCQERIFVEDNSQHPLGQGGRDLIEDSSGLVALEKRLIEVEKAMQELDKAISEMNSRSAVSPGVSKLVQNFELKGHTDESEERPPSTEDSDPHVTVKKKMDNLKDLFRGLVQNASELIKVKTSGETPSDSTLKELMARFDAMKEHNNSLEETFFKHVILDEFVKQYVRTVEAKKGEFVVLCEDLRQEGIATRTYNSELTEKLRSSESRIVELQTHVDELQQQADHMASLCNQLETLHRKLDASIGTISVTHSSDTVLGQNISTRVATSVEAAVAVIQDLQEKVEDTLRNHNLLSDSYNELAEKTKDLEGRNEFASYVIHKVFDNLQKIVNDLAPSTEQSEEDTTSEQLDHLEISNYDVLIERLIMILRERSQLESKNREYNLELLRKLKDMEELNKRCINPEFIVKFFEDIQCSVTLDGIEMKPDEPVSSLESMIQFLVKKSKSNDMKLIELQEEVDHLTFSVFPYEIENHVLKESLVSAMAHVVTIQSEAQLKETELHQAEQRVSALREKLHIAVTKGKGLIQHRDSLKQNLAAKSSELEKCLHELQLKEATLQETEAKLKSHSESGERVKALESELSYIRNSATALRESFLLKDSVLERIEEILEDLDLPEDFHVRDIIDKIDWLAKSVSQSQNSFPITSQTSSIERTHSRAMDGWIEDIEPSSGPADDELRRNYDELQNKFYGLAEHNEMLEQSLMERNNLVQRCEEVLDKINMPSQLRSLEPEDRIEWLRVALLEANDRCDLLHKEINDVEKIRGSLAADLEESQRRLADLESTLKSVTDEREQLSASLEAQSHDYTKVSEKSALYEIENDKLQNEVGALQLKLDEKLGDEERIQHVYGEIRHLQDLVKDSLQVPETEDLDSSTSDIQYLEVLLRKLVDKHITATSGLTHGERSVDQSDTNGELERKLEEVESDLVLLKDEKDRQVETNQSLVNEVEALKAKNQELQNLLVQEEQKCATVKEKLNVAVRKGKSLVQVRDSMKQTINDLTSQVERLDAEMKVRENTLLDHQEKMKNLYTLQELVENKDSEIRFLKNRLEEADSELLDKRNTLTVILGALTEIDLGVELRTNEPVEKLKQIAEVMHDLRVAMLSAEQESKKSKRAAELLLAELNEIQERNEDLLEEISELSEQRDSAEAAKRESLSHLEQLSALRLEERSSQFSELMNLKSGLDQLRPGFSKIYSLLNDVLPKDLDYLYNLEASVKSLLEISDTVNVGGQTRYSSQINAQSGLFFDRKTEELQLHDENKIVDLWRFIGTHMQGLIFNINGFEEKLEIHSKCLHEEIILLSETVAALGSEMTSYKHSFESTSKQKETENLMLRKYISMLYVACKRSVLEIEKSKGQLVPNDYSGEDILSGEIPSVSEEHITSMVDRLLTAVKDFHSIQSESVEVNLKEMKATISSLQKELTEKDVQKDRICLDLVGQIKRAEAAAMSHLQELETAKDQINDLKGQLEAVNQQRNSLEQKVKELEGQESELVDLHGKVKSLTDALTAKEQEAEALLQALDEEEAQMEEMTNKITELERVVQQKNLDLENSEAARGKALKKLSITVGKFDELHRLSETLVSEVDKLQSQLQERDSEVSFLRDEITRCTSDSLQALETDKKGVDEVQDILTWLDSMVSGVETNNMHLDENKIDQVHEYKETLKKQITSIISELKDLRQMAQSKDDLLHIERSKVDDLMRRRELLESSLREKESRLSLHENDSSSEQRTSLTSEIVEVEPVLNKWPSQGTSMATQVRSLRKVNNEQVAISIDDMGSDDKDKLEDDDDDKAHGFKSLTTSKLVPRFTRPVTDFVDGLWVSCDRTLMRQPALRLSLIFYWAVMHALLAVFVV